MDPFEKYDEPDRTGFDLVPNRIEPVLVWQSKEPDRTGFRLDRNRFGEKSDRVEPAHACIMWNIINIIIININIITYYY